MKPLSLDRLAAACGGGYTVRRLQKADLEELYAFCRSNPMYYEHCGAGPSRAGLARDLALLPPGCRAADKYYIGFYAGDLLAAVLDLVAGYPQEDAAFLGFFMVRGSRAGKGEGSRLVNGLAGYLREEGFAAARLGWEKSNPQAGHFWQKNGFVPQYEADHPYGRMVVGARAL